MNIIKMQRNPCLPILINESLKRLYIAFIRFRVCYLCDRRARVYVDELFCFFSFVFAQFLRSVSTRPLKSQKLSRFLFSSLRCRDKYDRVANAGRGINFLDVAF